MNKKQKQLILLVVITSVFLTACLEAQGSQVMDVEETIQPLGIIAEGTFKPSLAVELSFEVSGVVNEVLLDEGKSVQSGAVIARLSVCDSIEADLATTQADLVARKQEYSDLEEGAGLARAEALQALIDAQETFDEVQLDWDDYNFDAYETDLGEAQEDVLDAQEELDEAITDLEEYLDLEEDNPTRERYQDAVDDAERELHLQEQDQNEVQNEYLQAKQEFDLAASELEKAQREYDRKLEGPDEDDLVLLQSRIAALETIIKGLESNLTSCQIISPIDGILLANELTEGEFVQAGSIQVMVANLNNWQLFTDDVSEYEVVKIKEGQIVEVFVDALNSISLVGSVDSIDQVATLDHGDVTYTVTISISDIPTELRWGMTGSAHFE